MIYNSIWLYNHVSSTIVDASATPSSQRQQQLGIQPEATQTSNAPASNVKRSSKSKYGDEGYEELEK